MLPTACLSPLPASSAPQDGLPITYELHRTNVAMLTQMNRAIDTLPDLTCKVHPQTPGCSVVA